MFDNEKFTKRFYSLIKETDITKAKLATDLSTTTATISRYLNQKRIPKLDMLIKIANYFQCSLEYLIGVESEYYNYDFKECQNFAQRFRTLINQKGFELKEIHERTKIPLININVWLRGSCKPNIDYIMILANFFNLSVDDFLGR